MMPAGRGYGGMRTVFVVGHRSVVTARVTGRGGTVTVSRSAGRCRWGRSGRVVASRPTCSPTRSVVGASGRVRQRRLVRARSAAGWRLGRTLAPQWSRACGGTRSGGDLV
ncbi:hypothetical protein AArcS_1693 [Natranaeroarchaeum sulfidigenes]|uniref:Uncharacterized protein n=1 Tax=Natranaeroarchaeum sulfidigenes TaxID=2784880 RepID=A0A897MV19_9EURY|nr:hypothetical protein AArcS_1693 [Natranaeroarchaeum sulfidigenes]